MKYINYKKQFSNEEKNYITLICIVLLQGDKKTNIIKKQTKKKRKFKIKNLKERKRNKMNKETKNKMYSNK